MVVRHNQERYTLEKVNMMSGENISSFQNEKEIINKKYFILGNYLN